MYVYCIFYLAEEKELKKLYVSRVSAVTFNKGKGTLLRNVHYTGR